MLDKALETLKSVKLTGGIFGKTTLLLIVLCICVAAVCVRTGNLWLSLVLMAPLMGLVFYALKRCLDFAEANPYAAIMDGAELLVRERLIHGQKGQEALPTLEPVPDHDVPPAIEAQATNPDQTPRAIQGPSDNGAQ